jgi:signal peptidase
MWFLVLAALIGVYLLTDFALSELFTPFAASYVVQPILWISLGALVLRLHSRKPAGKASLRRPLLAAAAMAAALHVVLIVAAGFMSGFGKSPYSFAPSWIVTNLFYVGTALVGLELSRAYLVNNISRKRTTLVVGLVAVLYTLIIIPSSKWTAIGGGEATVTFLGETCLPLLARNLLATFIAYLGGPLPAIVYGGIILAFEWFSPLLPDLSTSMTALVGTAAPIVGFALIQYGLLPYYLKARSRRAEPRKASHSLPVGWMTTGILSVVLIWFSLGLFDVWPTVIYSGSMSPAIDVGDIAIVAEVKPQDVEIGDIVAYRTGESTTIHRVVDVDYGGDRVSYRTQGDANDIPDLEPVTPGQIQGRVVFTVPKIGWAAVGVKSWLFSSE